MSFTYIREVPQFDPAEVLRFDALSLGRLETGEAHSLAEHLRKRSVFSRHGDEYADRLRTFAGRPVLFADPSQSHRAVRELRWEADAVERLLVISRCFAERREQLHRNLAAHAIRESRSDIYVCPTSGNPVRSSRPDRGEEPLRLEARDLRRFCSHGFSEVQRVSAQPGFLGNRLRIVSSWLYASRTDPDVGSALVKTAVAAESLIAGVRVNGGITRQIKERLSALVRVPGEERDEVSDALGEHYNLRSDFAHGRQLDPPSESHRASLESFDRLVALGLASLAAFSPPVASLAEIDAWFRGGVPDAQRPFPEGAIRRALDVTP